MAHSDNHHHVDHLKHKNNRSTKRVENFHNRVANQHDQNHEEYLQQRERQLQQKEEQLKQLEEYLEYRAKYLNQKERAMSGEDAPRFNDRDTPDEPYADQYRFDSEFARKYNLHNKGGYYIHVPYLYNTIKIMGCVLESYSNGKITIFVPRINKRLIVPGYLDDLERAGIYTYIGNPYGEEDFSQAVQNFVIHNFSDRILGKIVGVKICPHYGTSYYYILIDDELITIPSTQLHKMSEEIMFLRYPYNNFPPSINYVGDSVAIEIVDRKINHVLLLSEHTRELIIAEQLKKTAQSLKMKYNN
jgi:hypothetical protein